jgi:dTDP-4-dehydrorhamnose 3,5-epimerase
MEIKTTPLEGLLILKPKVFNDSRGYFFESYQDQRYKQFGINEHFVQDNLSYSTKNVIRGLHFQKPPYAQGKLVSVFKGKVLDVVLDLRKNSPTFGNHFSIELSEENHLQLWIPVGFAHGFSVLSEFALFSYKCTNYYHQASEDGILYNDSTLKIDWNVENPIVSEKDLQLQEFKHFQTPFNI